MVDKKADTHTQKHIAMVACLQGQHLSVRPAMVSSAQITECCTSKLSLFLPLTLCMSVSSSLLCFLWLIDLKWQIRLVVSLCDVTPSLADRQPAVTC